MSPSARKPPPQGTVGSAHRLRANGVRVLAGRCAWRDGWQDPGMTPDPVAFAQQWVDEWNSLDLDRILAHYAPDVVFRSPIAARVLPESGGVVRGIDELRRYWGTALAQVPDLRFELIDVCAGLSTLLIRFRNQLGAVRCEVLRFQDGLVVEGEGTDLVELV